MSEEQDRSLKDIISQIIKAGGQPNAGFSGHMPGVLGGAFHPQSDRLSPETREQLTNALMAHISRKDPDAKSGEPLSLSQLFGLGANPNAHTGTGTAQSMTDSEVAAYLNARLGIPTPQPAESAPPPQAIDRTVEALKIAAITAAKNGGIAYG